MSEEIMDSLNRIQMNLLNAWRDPSVPRQNFDKAQKMFIKLLDTVNEELSPHKIMRLAFNEFNKRKTNE